MELHGDAHEIRALGESTIQGTPLCGEVQGGEPVTVWYLPMSAFPGSTTITLPTVRAMLGIHCDAEPRFRAAHLTFRNLTGWSGRMGSLKPEIEPSGFMKGVRYDRQPDVSAAVDGATIRLGDSIVAERSVDGDSLRRETQFLVEADEPLVFGEILGRYLRPLQHLMTFASDEGVAMRDVTLRTPAGGSEVTPIFAPVLTPDREDPGVWQPLFRLPEAPAGFEDLIPRWFDFYGRVEPLLDLLLLQKYISRVPFVEQRLLMNAQAAEGLHQRLPDRFGQHSLEPEDHSLLIDELETCVSDDRLRRWARDRLRRNDPSFRQRLLDLIEHAGSAVKDILRPTPEEWASRVRKARDRWTHWSTETGGATDGAELRALVEGLSVVLSSCVLAGLGFGDERREEIIRRSSAYRWTVALNDRASLSP